MKTRKVAIILYVISCSLAILATVIDNDILKLVSIPTVIPAIYYYYLSTKTTKINWCFVAVLVLNFIGDTIVLLEIKDQTLIIMIPYLLSYLLLLRFAIQDVREFRFNVSGLLLCSLIFLFLMYVMYALLELFDGNNQELIVPIIGYGLILGTYGCITVYCYYLKIAAYTFYLLMFALTSIVSDVFYIMFSFIFHIPFLNYFEFAVQLLSYYFVVKYFVLRRVISH